MGQLNTKMRKFMGWDSAEEDQFDDEFGDIEEDQSFDVTPLPSVAPLHPPVEVHSASDQMRIITMRPSSYTDAQTMGDHFRKGLPVILNLSEMPDEQAHRMVDFACGLTYGLRGRFEQITNRVFLLSPADVSTTFDSAPTEQRWLS